MVLMSFHVFKMFESFIFKFYNCYFYKTVVPLGVITYTRQVVHKLPDWRTLQVDLSRLHVSSMGTIEDDGTGMLQVLQLKIVLKSSF